MFLFIDESGKLDPNNQVLYPTLAGILLKREALRDLCESLFQLKGELCRRLYDELGNFTLDGIPDSLAIFKKNRKIGHKIPRNLYLPSDFEMKGRELLNSRILEKIPWILDIFTNLLDICKGIDIKVFATIAKRPKEKPDQEILTKWYRWLLERVNKCLVENNRNEDAKRYCHIIHDNISYETNRKISINFYKYIFTHHDGKSWEYIPPSLNFADSSITPGLEVADCIAYIISQTHGREGREELESLKKDILNLEWKSIEGFKSHLGRGIRYIKTI